MAALQIKNIPTGAGDDIKFDATYAVGNTKNVISTSGGSPSFAMFSQGNAFYGSYQSVGFGSTTDAVFVPGGQLELTRLRHPRCVQPQLGSHWSTSSVRQLDDGEVQQQRQGSLLRATTAQVQAVVSADYSCNPDFGISQLGVVTRWTPVKNLTFSAEVQWFHLDQKFTGAAILRLPVQRSRLAAYKYKDQDTISLNVRAQRNF